MMNKFVVTANFRRVCTRAKDFHVVDRNGWIGEWTNGDFIIRGR